MARGEIIRELYKESKKKGRRGRGFQRFVRAIARTSGKVLKKVLTRRLGI